MPKIAIVCGGTGGHIYPALAVAEYLPKDEIVFLGTEERLESALVKREGYIFKKIDSDRKNPLILLKGFFQALWFFLNKRPAVILSTGGYVTVPVLLAGALLRIPIYIQEQNLLPGKVNRLLKFLARKVFYSFPDTQRYFSKDGMYTGNPVRKNISTLIPATCHLPLATCNILVLGGSQGSQAIDDTITKIDFGALNCALTHLNKQNYVHDMAPLLQRTDLAICRAGATTLAELAVAGIPAILIPYPFAAEDHQQLNAEFFTRAGAAMLIEQSRLSPQLLTSIIKTILENPGQLEKMSVAMRKLARPEAAGNIAIVLKQVVSL